MTGTARRILIIFLAAFIAAMTCPAMGQEAAEPASQGPSAESFTGFDEDASLFVGYYRLNPGDSVLVEIISSSVRSYQAMIDDEGYIALPVLGRISVADMTLTEAREEIQRLTDEYYVNAWATIRIVQLGKVKFYVYGDVDVPGFYTATGATTFFDFLQRWELASSAEHRRIVHVRGVPLNALPEPRNLFDEYDIPMNALVEESLEYYDRCEPEKIDPLVTIVDPLEFSLEGLIEQRNFYLEYGDVIYVPDPAVVTEMRGFRRPGIYEVLPGETWSDLIAYAGQPGLNSDISSMLLERYSESGELEQIYYNLNLLDEGQLNRIPLQNRDRLRVSTTVTSVFVLGEVGESGSFNYTPSLGPLDYIALAGGATPDAHLRFVSLVRPPRDPSAPLETSEVFQVDLVETINAGAASSRVAVQPGDIIYVPDRGEEFNFGDVLSSVGVVINAIRLFD